MSDTKTIDASGIAFASTVFPSREDRARWEMLMPAERLEIIARDEEAGYRSGVAQGGSMAELLAEVRAEAEK